MKTYQPNNQTVNRTWRIIDAENQVLGRLATKVAGYISGKGKPTYAPHVDSGDYVVVVNADKVRITGANKPIQKIDFRHSGYPSGYTITPYSRFLKEKPERAVELAVSGMLPKNRLRKTQMKRLRIFKGTDHPHGAHFAAPKSKTAEAPSQAEGKE